MPKKAPKGAFFFFLLDYKKRCEKNGETFPNGIRDEFLKENAGAEWQVMRAQDKLQYEDMAKEEKRRAKSGTAYRETNMHRSFASIDKQKREEEEDRQKTIDWINEKIQSLSVGNYLAEEVFYLIHVNYFCLTTEGNYIPAEIAIAEFSLASGISNVFHRFVAGTIPLGFSHDAIQKAEQTHKIPPQNDGEKDFEKLHNEIKKFMERGRESNRGEFPPLFTMPDNVLLNTSTSAVKSFFFKLNEFSYDPVDWRVYPLEKLFFTVKNACANKSGAGGAAFPQLGLATMELEKDIFNFTSEIACSFHNQEDAVQHCSKSFVQRWVYLICDHCCLDLDIQLVPGRHVPQNTDVDCSSRQAQKNFEKPKQPAPFTWVDNSKAGPSDSWGSPLPRAQGRSNRPGFLNTDENNFPNLGGGSSVRGRGRSAGGAPMSFAAAMRK